MHCVVWSYFTYALHLWQMTVQTITAQLDKWKGAPKRQMINVWNVMSVCEQGPLWGKNSPGENYLIYGTSSVHNWHTQAYISTDIHNNGRYRRGVKYYNTIHGTFVQQHIMHGTYSALRIARCTWKPCRISRILHHEMQVSTWLTHMSLWVRGPRLYRV